MRRLLAELAEAVWWQYQRLRMSPEDRAFWDALMADPDWDRPPAAGSLAPGRGDAVWQSPASPR
jgi:hypothetical protein